MNLFKSTLIATALVAAGFVGNANAASVNQDFKVKISITGSCTFISASDINFAATAATPGTRDATGTIKVQCTNNLPFSVQLNSGVNGGGNVNARKMTSGSNSIAYQLYSDNFSTVWGTATSGTGLVGGIGAGFGGTTLDKSFTVSARATLVGTEPVASYEDTITATVTY
jgi:spore coat protein U-like protein